MSSNDIDYEDTGEIERLLEHTLELYDIIDDLRKDLANLRKNNNTEMVEPSPK
tara:strand:+ start:1264 stop:1422 length:159 start_codon:yes stop_codon:yes gene_type:complete